MRDVMQADKLDAVVIWMSVLAFMFGVILAAMMAMMSRQVDLLRRRVEQLESNGERQP